MTRVQGAGLRLLRSAFGGLFLLQDFLLRAPILGSYRSLPPSPCCLSCRVMLRACLFFAGSACSRLVMYSYRSVVLVNK